MSDPIILCICPFYGRFGREVFEGISRYARFFTNWQLHLLGKESQPEEMDFQLTSAVIHASWLPGSMETVTKKWNGPLVSACLFDKTDHRLPIVTTDNYAIGIMAAEYFMGKGFRNFYFDSQGDDQPPSRERFRGFSETLARKGYKAERNIPAEWHPEKDSYFSEAARKRWLQRKTPCAVFLSHDSLMQSLSILLRSTPLRLPVDLAMLGVDDDPYICEHQSPSLSSIKPDYIRVGYEAARMLNTILKGEAPDTPLLIPPIGVTERESTDIDAINDDLGQKLLHYIRNNFHRPLKINEIATRLFASRRTLETRCRKLFDKSPHDLIVDFRMKQAIRFLEQSDLTIEEISSRCGYKYQHQFAKIFRKTYNITATEYRKLHS